MAKKISKKSFLGILFLLLLLLVVVLFFQFFQPNVEGLSTDLIAKYPNITEIVNVKGPSPTDGDRRYSVGCDLYDMNVNADNTLQKALDKLMTDPQASGFSLEVAAKKYYFKNTVMNETTSAQTDKSDKNFVYRKDGMPFFLPELTKTLTQDSGNRLKPFYCSSKECKEYPYIDISNVLISTDLSIKDNLRIKDRKITKITIANMYGTKGNYPLCLSKLSIMDMDGNWICYWKNGNTLTAPGSNSDKLYMGRCLYTVRHKAVNDVNGAKFKNVYYRSSRPSDSLTITFKTPIAIQKIVITNGFDYYDNDNGKVQNNIKEYNIYLYDNSSTNPIWNYELVNLACLYNSKITFADNFYKAWTKKNGDPSNTTIYKYCFEYGNHFNNTLELRYV